MARAFEAKPTSPPAPRTAERPAAPAHALPPAADFTQLANRLHVGAPVQRRAADGPARDFSGIKGPGRPPIPGGLPAGLRADVEARSGLPMDDVRVHRHSPKPARIGALAYAQGHDIHLGPGQERHLAHEAWHVVQQKQGRVRPTLRMNGLGINDDPALEREVDGLGFAPQGIGARPATPVIQRMLRRRPQRDNGDRDREEPAPEREPEVRGNINAPPVHAFDGATNAAFVNRTGGADIKSEDKTFHVLDGQEDRVWAVASGGTLAREHATLALIRQHGGNTVHMSNLVPATVARNNTTHHTVAYAMNWVPNAVSSKSQGAKFLTTLKGLSGAQRLRAQQSIAAFRTVGQQIDVQDFQAVLDPATGEIHANDPRGHMGPSPTGILHTRLNTWEAALAEGASDASIGSGPGQQGPSSKDGGAEGWEWETDWDEPEEVDQPSREKAD